LRIEGRFHTGTARAALEARFFYRGPQQKSRMPEPFSDSHMNMFAAEGDM
jgi:hypothetical protein